MILDNVFKQITVNMLDSESDSIQKLILYCLIKLERKGASLYLEYLYLDSFSPEAIK